MRKIQNQDELFIANGTITTHVPHGTSFLSNWSTLLEDGEVVLVNMANNTVHNAAFPTTGMYRFYGRSGSQLLMSNVFDASTVTKTERVYAAQTEQVDYVGYNGTSGSMDASTAKDEIFTLHIDIIGATRTDFNRAMIKEGHYITTSTSTAQWAIAQGLVRSLVANFSRFPNPVMRFERTCDENMAAIGSACGAATVVYGSDIVTFASSVTDTTGGATIMTLGDAIRIGGLTNTYPVYLITAIDTTNKTITLDVPYQGATGTVLAAAIENLANATAIAAEWGLKLTGIAQPYSIQKYPPQVIRWNANFTKIDANAKEATPTATVTNSTGAVLGTGTYAQVAELERELQMGDGAMLYSDIPMHTDYRAQANSAKTYNMVHVHHVKNMTTHLGQEAPSHCGISLALDTALDTSVTQGYDITPSNAAGTNILTIVYNGVTINANVTHDGTVATTITNFCTAYEAVLEAMGMVVTDGTTKLTIVGAAGSNLVITEAGTGSGTQVLTIASVTTEGWHVFGLTDDAGSTL